ncbi:MAG: ABC transporter permease [Sphingobacterium sp.]
MIKNYIKIAWRSILKNKLFSLLNIIGLSVSLCISILLLAYTNKELSFDRMYPKVEEIYRVKMKTTQEYNYQEWVTIPNAVGPAIKKDVPGVIASTRLLRDDFGSPASIMVNQQTFIESGIYLADSSIFSMFDIKFVEGNSTTVFKEKNSIVISQSKKEKLFGSKSAINELIYINQRDTLQITGVFEDLPQHSTLDCEMIYNIMDTRLGQNEYWGNASYETYLQLDNAVDPKIVENNATKLIDKYVEKEDQYFSDFSLQPLKEVHLYSTDFRPGYTSRVGSIGLVKNLLYLAALIALIASINYMNLATARTSRQTKEIGVNKILGASKKQVSTRFYIETFIITLISIAFGFILSLLTIPLFNAITGIEILMHELVTIQMAIALVCCWIVISVLAGSFPAIHGIDKIIEFNWKRSWKKYPY